MRVRVRETVLEMNEFPCVLDRLHILHRQFTAKYFEDDTLPFRNKKAEGGKTFDKPLLLDGSTTEVGDTRYRPRFLRACQGRRRQFLEPQWHRL